MAEGKDDKKKTSLKSPGAESIETADDKAQPKLATPEPTPEPTPATPKPEPATAEPKKANIKDADKDDEEETKSTKMIRENENPQIQLRQALEEITKKAADFGKQLGGSFVERAAKMPGLAKEGVKQAKEKTAQVLEKHVESVGRGLSSIKAMFNSLPNTSKPEDDNKPKP